MFNFQHDVDSIKKEVDRVEKEEVSIPFDSNKFKTFAALPENVTNDVIYQLASLFDGNVNLHEPEDNKQIGPNTADKIKDSLAVIYIVQDGIPVAGATLLDPTTQNYKGIIPKDYYELKSGISLSGRILQEFFVVAPDKHNLGLAQELKGKLQTLAPKMFVIVPIDDKDTQYGLLKNEYSLVAEFETDWETVPVQLWLN